MRDLRISLAGGLLALTLGATAADLDTVKVVPRGDRASVPIGATVIPHKAVTLTAQLPGRVVTIAGEEGDRFEEGEVIVSLDKDKLRAEQKAARARLEDARATLANAGVQYRRELASPSDLAQGTPGGMGLPGMFDQMFVEPMQGMMGMQSPQMNRWSNVYGRQTAVAQARSALQEAASRIEEVKAKLRDADSVAPFDGVLLRKWVEQGDPVQPGEPLVELADTSRLQVRADVPAELVAGIHKGQRLNARLRRGGPLVPVEVSRVFPSADPNRHTVPVEADLVGEVEAAPGQYAELWVPEQRRDVAGPYAVVPRSAVVRRHGLDMVFLVNQKGTTELRAVRLGESIGPDRVVVLSGLAGGETLVADPPPGFTAGTRVRDSQ